MIHELKTWIDSFTAIVSGMKRHEIRKNDRQFEPGDILVLREYDDKEGEPTGRNVIAAVTYVSRGGTWGLPVDLDVLSIKLMVWTHDDPVELTDADVAEFQAKHATCGSVARSAFEDRLKEWSTSGGPPDDAGTC